MFGLSLCTTLLAACGGGGGGGSNDIALKSESDVTREISNLYGVYNDIGPAGPAPAAPRSAPAKRAGMLTARGYGVSPNAETGECDSGSFTTDSFTATTCSLPLFAANPSVDYHYTDSDDCTVDGGSYESRADGYEEFGDNFAYTQGTAESPRYEYYAYGQGSASHTVRFSSQNESWTARSRGRGEYRDNGSSLESRQVYELVFTGTFGNFSERVEFAVGEEGNPLVIVDNYAASTGTIDGPFRYHSSDTCDGGRLDYDTIQPLVFTQGDTSVFISGGEVAISSGSSTATLVFQPDGDVTYTLPNGTAGEVTRDELSSFAGCAVF